MTVCSYCPVTLCARAPAQLDLEGTGYLSPHVLRDALKRWNSDASDHTVDEMIRCIDADGACTRIRFQPNSQNRPKKGSSLTDACLCVSSLSPRSAGDGRVSLQEFADALAKKMQASG